jgi:prolyl-tRNA editing enzyme YbaK/EbsC (Cys-tRNA(Pro) deacylase)
VGTALPYRTYRTASFFTLPGKRIIYITYARHILMTRTRAGKVLHEHGLWFREHSKDERSDHICKTVMFKRKDGTRIAALMPLQFRVSYRKLKEHYKQDVSPLSPEELRAEGFEPGEVAPMLVACELVVDPSCFTQEEVQTGSGHLEYGVTWHIRDLEKMKRFALLDVREEK